jgi:hypothetical protein
MQVNRPIPHSNLDASVTSNHIHTIHACAVSRTFLPQHSFCYLLVFTVHHSSGPLRLLAAQSLYSRCDHLNDRGRRAATSSQCRHPPATARPRYRRSHRRRHRELSTRGARAPTWRMGRAAPSGRASPRGMTQAHRTAQMDGSRGAQGVLWPQRLSTSTTSHVVDSVSGGLVAFCWIRALPAVLERDMAKTKHVRKTSRANTAHASWKFQQVVGSQMMADRGPYRLIALPFLGTGRTASRRSRAMIRMTASFDWAKQGGMRGH